VVSFGKDSLDVHKELVQLDELVERELRILIGIVHPDHR
tara:strand:+ start:587 stop:703 length:117 start_codon:yes stop_codon:yes gene_type:complete